MGRMLLKVVFFFFKLIMYSIFPWARTLSGIVTIASASLGYALGSSVDIAATGDAIADEIPIAGASGLIGWLATKFIFSRWQKAKET